MGTFTGFSEDDIRKLQIPESNKLNDNNKDMHKKRSTTNKKVTFKNTTKVITNDTKNKTILNTKLTNTDLPKEAKLSVTPSQEDALNGNTIVINKSSIMPEMSNALPEVADTFRNNTETNQIETKVLSTNCNAVPTVEHTDIVKINKHTNEMKQLDLREFEIRQKLIEEQNKRRKELLSKALAARTKRTQDEAKKLEEIQCEFKKLDADLSNDVKILRHQIDLASMEYMEVQKRYIKAEREFLEMKLLLHQKLERKEMLTEHLCTIIEKNEERKANKLTELLNKLQLEDGTESKENSLQAVNGV